MNQDRDRRRPSPVAGRQGNPARRAGRRGRRWRCRRGGGRGDRVRHRSGRPDRGRPGGRARRFAVQPLENERGWREGRGQAMPNRLRTAPVRHADRRGGRPAGPGKRAPSRCCVDSVRTISSVPRAPSKGATGPISIRSACRCWCSKAVPASWTRRPAFVPGGACAFHGACNRVQIALPKPGFLGIMLFT